MVAGSYSVRLEYLTRAVHGLNFVLFNNKVKGLHASDSTKISNIQDLLWPVQKGTDPHKLICLTRSLSCLDPRDRAFGLLSLFPSDFTCQITEAMVQEVMSKKEWLYRRRVEYIACINGTHEDLSAARMVHRVPFTYQVVPSSRPRRGEWDSVRSPLLQTMVSVLG